MEDSDPVKDADLNMKTVKNILIKLGEAKDRNIVILSKLGLSGDSGDYLAACFEKLVKASRYKDYFSFSDDEVPAFDFFTNNNLSLSMNLKPYILSNLNNLVATAPTKIKDNLRGDLLNLSSPYYPLSALIVCLLFKEL